MLCLSFYEWRCIYPCEQMILATFLEKSSLDRAPRRFADYLFVPKHPKADVLLTTVLGPLRRLLHVPFLTLPGQGHRVSAPPCPGHLVALMPFGLRDNRHPCTGTASLYFSRCCHQESR